MFNIFFLYKMDLEVKKILQLINKHGYEAYIVGGYVRDYLLNIPSNDYDLCTNAHPDTLKKILNAYPISEPNYTTMTIQTDKAKIEITTYRKELIYLKRKPVKYEYVNSLKEDLKRRDFKINTLCLDSEGHLIDLMHGLDDLKNKIIRSVGNPYKKMEEDPLRILRAIRFSACLDFQIDSELVLAICKYKKELRTLSYQRKKEEIEKLIKIKRLDILKYYQLDNYLELDLNRITYFDDMFLVWVTIDKNNKYIFKAKEKKIANQVRQLEKLELNDYNVYKYGKEVSNLVGQLKNIDATKIYSNLPIKSRYDINIDIDDLKRIIPNSHINKIYDCLARKIIDGQLKNNREEIMSYLKRIKHTI